MDTTPFISVIIPVYNGGKLLNLCLDAIRTSSYQAYEIIVVDDGSSDDSAEIARAKGARVYKMVRQSGPAAARNIGAQKSRGEILFFVDADVQVRPDTLVRVAEDLLNEPEVAAVFGSYDDSPAEKNFVSQYKNLFHHFVHQHSNTEAVTFWAGCGAIRRQVFTRVGGFNQYNYPEPSIEDVELGYRMRSMRFRILLDKQLQAKHLKLWRLGSMLRADIFCRAVPWSTLILQSGHMVNDLNLRISDRVSAGLAGLTFGLLPFSVLLPGLLYASILFACIIVIVNHKLYRFFIDRRGLKFALLALPLQLLYHTYCAVTFGLCWCRHFALGNRPRFRERTAAAHVQTVSGESNRGRPSHLSGAG